MRTRDVKKYASNCVYESLFKNTFKKLIGSGEVKLGAKYSQLV